MLSRVKQGPPACSQCPWGRRKEEGFSREAARSRGEGRAGPRQGQDLVLVEGGSWRSFAQSLIRDGSL